MSTREQPSPSDPDDDRPRPGKAAGRPRGGTVPPQSRTGEDGRTADGDGDPPSSVGRLAATVERLRRQVTAAHAAADGRALVELAKGVLVERLKCSPAEAARQLSALAGQAGLSQLELAADIVNEAARDRLTEAACDFVERAASPAREEVSGTSLAVRLRTAESASLAADDTQAVAESLLEHALAPLGATAVAVWTVGPDGSLTLAGHAGFATGEAGRWRYVPPGVATAARQALAERRTVWFPSFPRAGVPSIGHQHTRGGRVVVPAGTGGRIHGVLEICWPHALAPQPPRIERQVEALAELCAHTLETCSPNGTGHATAGSAPPSSLGELVDLADGLYDPALVLLPCVDAEGVLTDFRIYHTNSCFVDPAGRPRSAVEGVLLLEAYPMAAGDSDLFEKVERVHATGEPFRARRMPLTALVDQVPLKAVADVSISRHGGSVLLIWRIEDEMARLASLLQHAQRLGRIGGFEENTVTGDITWNSQLFTLYGLPPAAAPIPLRELAGHAHPDDSVAIGRFLRTLTHHRRPASSSFRLQRPDGVTRHIRVVAEPVLDAEDRLLAVRGAYQDISAQHWTEVALAATRDQLAHTEQQSAERDRLALQLQHAIMPPTRAPIDVPGLQVAVRYRPAESDSLVGGDWYDAVVLPSRQVLLCVGDVAGHGIQAATSMVVLRNALRGLAVTGASPAQLLSWLNTVAHHLTEHVTATAVCGLYDPATRVLRWARAGHLPPVLVRGRQATALPLLGGLLLGAVGEAMCEEGELLLREGDVLLMYTDGLVERRDRSVHESLAHLLTTARVSAPSVEQLLEHVLTHSRADTDDDTCVIGIQVV
ncbi:antitermination regulator [Streptomyces cinnamoneus]|uniref:Antitermination regulator n=2 Tax=Streptomyces cinnamoneus TaxID=53446 RepID=A0A2G1XNS6_STRCJ|nr:SpoIIE family protein phosphatase [Streptomyces cinnamoneus]PHQ52841.1 antitermination regulator [Streptomyces cinnamoneus]PPT11790.1 ANTAR domain-containing protein [Streptomyces cinnamoneus]